MHDDDDEMQSEAEIFLDLEGGDVLRKIIVKIEILFLIGSLF